MVACVASVSVGFPRKFRCFGRAKIKARARSTETLATQAMFMVILAINLSFSRVSYETGNVVLTFSYAATRNLGDKENSAQDEANYEVCSIK